MSATSTLETLFESKSRPQGARDCGAICLSAVYRSLGKEVSPAEIWPEVSKENHFGSLASTTHLMTQDALNRGFAAVAFQARHPLLMLQRCRDWGVRAILNHRLRQGVPTGHYTVLADIDSQNVVLYDPSYDSSVTLSHSELLELWQPHFPNSEIVGYMLIGVAPRPSEALTCHLCRTPLPSSIECPRCRKAVGLEPGAILGCVSNACIARTWKYICCPTCDYTWDLTAQPDLDGAAAAVPTPASPGPAEKASAAQSLDINKLFGELDKFSAFLLALPAAAGHSDIKKQLSFISSSKEKLKAALDEVLASREKRQAQMSALIEQVQAQSQAQPKPERTKRRAVQPNPSAPPLDGHALGRALMRNLGWDS